MEIKLINFTVSGKGTVQDRTKYNGTVRYGTLWYGLNKRRMAFSFLKWYIDSANINGAEFESANRFVNKQAVHLLFGPYHSGPYCTIILSSVLYCIVDMHDYLIMYVVRII